MSRSLVFRLHERWSYPVDPAGVFDPSARPELWPLKLSRRWSSDDEAEARAIATWRHWAHYHRWIASRAEWSRGAWEEN